MDIDKSIQDTIYIGTKTLETLSEQENTIKNINDNLNSIQNNLYISDILISKMQNLGFRIKSFIFGNHEDKLIEIKKSDTNDINTEKDSISEKIKIIKEINYSIGSQLDAQNHNLSILNHSVDNKVEIIKQLNLKIDKI